MTAMLNREELFAACRALYNMAEGHLILPPLIRDAATLESSDSGSCYILTPIGRLQFVAKFDSSYARSASFPLDRLPVRFEIEFSHQGRPVTPNLGDLERKALIRAFLLGAKVPIIARKNRITPEYKIFLQISPTFFLECGELEEEGGDLTLQSVCDKVSRELFARSQACFANLDDGLEVWSRRVAQELFGDPRPPAEFFWPHRLQYSPGRVSSASSSGILLPAPIPAMLSAPTRPPASAGNPRGSISSTAIVASKLRPVPGIRPRLLRFHFAVACFVAGLALVASQLAYTDFFARTMTGIASESPEFLASTEPESIPSGPRTIKASAAAATQDMAPEGATPFEEAHFRPESPQEPDKGQHLSNYRKGHIFKMAKITNQRHVEVANEHMSNFHEASHQSKAQGLLRSTTTKRAGSHQGSPLVVVGHVMGKITTGIASNVRRISYRLSSLLTER
jgi:hypothetical protein